MGIALDLQLNEEFINKREGIISENASRLKIYVTPTNEELLIARNTARLVSAH